MSKTLLSAALVAILAAVAPLVLAQQPVETPPEPKESEARAKDPVCKMMVRHDPELSAEHAGEVYYFCMKKDLEAFEQDPEKFLEGEDHQHPEPNLED